MAENKKDKLAKRTVQILGFGTAFFLLLVRIISAWLGRESGISEFFIAGMVGVGVSAEIDFVSFFRREK